MALGRVASRMGWRLNLLMFLATLATTTLAGSLVFSAPADPALGPFGFITADPMGFLEAGLAYSVPLLMILGAHEMGHYLYCRYYGVQATLPYFIPAPHMFGTFGAVIRMRPPLPGRKALFDIGIAGPIAGFLVAVPILAHGVATARVEAMPSAPGEYWMFADPLLLKLLYRLLRGALAPGMSLVQNAALQAAWFGMLMTAMNLFPVGQLDGGHVVRALSRRLHGAASRLTIAAMIALVSSGMIRGLAAGWGLGGSGATGLAVFGAAGLVFAYGSWHLWPRALARTLTLVLFVLIFECFWIGVFTPWLLWTVVLIFMGRAGHPPLDEGEAPLGWMRHAAAWGALAIFALCFMPVPIEIVTLP
jgi:membrane-associated protease RseP (regulator of RpoE activity)